MKKIIFFIIFIFFVSCNTAYCAITVGNVGSDATTIGTEQISKQIQVTISGLLNVGLKLNAKALDDSITNTTNNAYKIPISQLYINNGTKDNQMVKGVDVAIESGISINIGGYTKNYTCIVKNIKALPPGTYRTTLQFSTDPDSTPKTVDYLLEFVIPLSQNIDTTTKDINITLTPANVFDGATTIENTVTPQISIKSNSKWKLILDTTGIGALNADYYFLITGVTTNVTSYITAQTKIEPNKQYILASGNATLEGFDYSKDYINIKYFLKNTSGTYISEGTYKNDLTYKIESGT